MRLRKHLTIVVLLAPVAGALVADVVLAPVERRISDARLPLRPDAGWPDDLVLVRIDDVWPWPPAEIRDLLAALEDAGATTIAVDAMLPPAPDDATAEHLAGALGRVVLAVPWVATRASLRAEDAALLDPALLHTRAPGTRFAAAGFLLPPARYASAALALGHSIAERDRDGLVRRTRPLAAIAGAGGSFPSAPFAAWMHQRGIDPHAVAATAAAVALPDGSAVPLPMELDLAGGRARSIPAREARGADLKGALAVVCVDVASVGDRAPTPLGETAGCDLFAAAVRTLDARSWPRRVPAVAAVLALAVALLVLRRAPWTARLAAAWVAASIALVPTADLHLPVVAPLVLLGAYAVAARKIE